MSSFDVSAHLTSLVDGTGNEVSGAVLTGKTIGLYFSAHWCGPCRSFTPKLVEKYKQIKEAGHNFEIVFISADHDEISANEYFSSMPWLMKTFNSDEALSTLMKVEGIPTLVLIDQDGKILTKDGTSFILQVSFENIASAIQAKSIEKLLENEILLDTLLNQFTPSDYFIKHGTIGKDYLPVKVEDLQRKTVGLYFSAHWCPPCRSFTPLLANKYQQIKEAGHPFEIIFISSDNDELSFADYYSHMPWLALPYAQRAVKAALSKKYEVNGIPTLILLNPDGSILSKNGRDVIMKYVFEDWSAYEENLRLEKEKLVQLIAHLPEEIIIPQHDHLLKKLPSVYRGDYGCDVCKGQGSGWVYHCDVCAFDAHPKCACNDQF